MNFPITFCTTRRLESITILINIFFCKTIGLNTEKSRETEPLQTTINEDSIMGTEDTNHSTEGEEVCEIMKLKLF
jgi:hypothetical protein